MDMCVTNMVRARLACGWRVDGISRVSSAESGCGSEAQARRDFALLIERFPDHPDP